MKKCFVVMLLFIILFSCKKKVEKIDIKKRPVVSPPSPVIITGMVPVKREKYVYEGLAFRDPFIPLSGEKVAKAKLGLTENAIVPSLGSLELKGIVIDNKTKEKVALFSSPYGGYILVNNKLYDKQNRLVTGITGKVVSQGVILITDDGTLKEFYFSKE